MGSTSSRGSSGTIRQPRKTKAYIKIKHEDKLGDASNFTIVAGGKQVAFTTPGTTAWLVVSVRGNVMASDALIHCGVLFEGPVLVGEERCRYLLLHSMPKDLRVEGDDSLSSLTDNMLRIIQGDNLYQGERKVLNPNETPASAFKEKCWEIMRGKPYENRGVSAEGDSLNSYHSLVSRHANFQAAQRRVQQYDTQNCRRFAQIFSAFYKLDFPEDLVGLHGFA